MTFPLGYVVHKAVYALEVYFSLHSVYLICPGTEKLSRKTYQQLERRRSRLYFWITCAL